MSKTQDVSSGLGSNRIHVMLLRKQDKKTLNVSYTVT